MRIGILFTLVLSVLCTQAQKRNIISYSGIFYDYLLKSEQSMDVSELAIANKTGFTAGYDRLVGNRLSVGIKYVKFFGTGQEGQELISFNSEALSPSYEIRDKTITSGSFSERGQGFVYESKFFFDDFDSDGANSGYIGTMYSRLKFEESVFNMRIEDNSSYYMGSSIPIPDLKNSYTINRLGLKWGYIASGALSSEVYFAGFMNFSNSKNAKFDAPTSLAKFSFVVGWVLGVPF